MKKMRMKKREKSKMRKKMRKKKISTCCLEESYLRGVIEERKCST